MNQFLTERDHGRTTFTGALDEPARVTINGQPAKVTSTNGSSPFRFRGTADLAVGPNTVVVEAKDGQDNVASKSYSVTTTGASTTFEYDANGNLRYEKQPNGTIVREYRWDQQNRLVGANVGTHESIYEYDGASHRIRVRELENSIETKNETFVWCGFRICQKRTGSVVLRSYFKDGFEESGTIDYYYTRDHLGSVREVVASDGTTVGSRLSYDPWGVLSESGSVLSDFAYTGHLRDRALRLTLAPAREYDASLGRWISMDPISLQGGLNLYAYVDNDPVHNSDPSGLFLREAVVVTRNIAGALCIGSFAVGFAAGTLIACTVSPSRCDLPEEVPTTVFAGENAPNTPTLFSPAPPQEPDDEDDDDDCKRKATPWELNQAGIVPHEAKQHLRPMSHFDICKCQSGGFAIKLRGCRGNIIERI